MNTRAKAGQGRGTLQRIAREVAGDLGHDLGNFIAKGTKPPRDAAIREQLAARGLVPDKPVVFQARCRSCFALAVVDQREWEHDGRGFGGSATKSACIYAVRGKSKSAAEVVA